MDYGVNLLHIDRNNFSKKCIVRVCCLHYYKYNQVIGPLQTFSIHKQEVSLESECSQQWH